MGRGVRRAAAWCAALLALPGGPAAAAPDLPAGCTIAVGGGTLLLAQVTPAALPGVRAVARGFGGDVTGGIPKLSVVEIALPATAGTATEAAAEAALRSVPGVGWVEREHVHRAARTVNDSLARHQWGLKAVNAYTAWDRETGSRNSVTVAVLDTGIAYNHPDLAGRTVDGPSAVGTATSRDDHGHGTLVGGVIGAIPNNRVGVAGVSWAPRLLSVKVLDSDGTGTDCSVVNGFVDAVEAGADVINMSLSANVACPTVWDLAMRYGEQNDVVAVAASGNDALKGNPVETPASCENVLAVGAYDSKFRIAKFSGHHDYVALSGPGVDVLSTAWDSEEETTTYGFASGTSLAAPYVAGVAALVRAKHPDWTAAQVRDRLTSTARDLGTRGRDAYFGFGGVDAAKAVAN